MYTTARRKARRPMSFRTRLSFLVAAAVGVAVAIAAMVSSVVVRHQLYSNFDNQLQHETNTLIQGGFRDLLAGNDGASGRYDLNEATVAQLLINGSPVETLPRNAPPLPVDKTDLAVAAGTHAAVKRTVKVDGVSERILTVSLQSHLQGVPVQLANGDVVAANTLALQVAQPLTYLDQTLTHLRIYLLLIALGGIVAALLLGDLVARATIRPVERLTAAAEHVAATQELDATIEEEGDDELTRLAHSFNSMLGALSASRHQQAQLVADAGHELRTPLTSLRTNIEVLMRVGDLPASDRAELLDDVRSQLEELTTLVGDLVELAREDEQKPEAEIVRFDIIIERAAERARRRATSLHFDVNLVPAWIHGQPALLERAVLNVLDNAAKWSPAGGTVTVNLTRTDGWVLTVRDRGPGIAPEDLPHVLDRFYRAPSARAMPGSGLGLAIVDQVVRSHGGTLSVGSPIDGGTLVQLHLPAVDQESASGSSADGDQGTTSGGPPENHPAGATPH